MWSCGPPLFDAQNLHPKPQMVEISVAWFHHRKSGAVTMSLLRFATSNQLETVLLSQFPNLHNKRPHALPFEASNRRFTLSKQTWQWTLHLFDGVYSLLNEDC